MTNSTAVVTKEEYQAIREIKKEIFKALKWELRDDEEVKIFVKVYDCYDDTNYDGTQQSYDVEINYAIDGEEYTDGYTNDSFYSNVYECEEARKQAVKRAKAVLKTVKGWFADYDNVIIADEVEVYHA